MNEPTANPFVPDTRVGAESNPAEDLLPDLNGTGAYQPTGDTDARPLSTDPSGTGAYVPGQDAPLQMPARHDTVTIPGHEILDELGRGGMGVVFKARQVKAERIVAVKLMKIASSDGPARRRFDEEAKAVAQLQHPNIVQVFEVGETDGMPYFTLEFVPGEPLDRQIRRALPGHREAATMMAKIARAMAYAHSKGVIHRDLKPANVLVTPAGEPKIADFGLARRTEAESHLTRAGTILGTPSYMAPEQAVGDPDSITPSADVYSLGAILYEMLTGRSPFKGANFFEILEQVRTADPLAPSLLQPRVSRDLETICLKCLQKQPSRRYASADALAEELDRYLAGKPILARRIGAVERSVRWCRRNKVAAALIGVLFLMVSGTAAAAVVIQRGRDLAERRLDLYRGAVFAFVNEAPAILANNPMAGSSRTEMLELTLRILNEAQDGDVGSANDWGRQAIAVRKGDIAMLSEKDLDKAEMHYTEARTIAEDVRKREATEKDKATGNLAQAITKIADLALARGKGAAGQDNLAGASEQRNRAIGLFREALELRQGVVDKPQSTEILRHHALADLGRAHLYLATALRDSKDFEAAMTHARIARDSLERAIPDMEPGSHKAETAARDRALALVERARLAYEISPPEDARAAYAEAVTAHEALVAKSPKNLGHRINLSVAANECGDHLLLHWNRPADAERLFTIAQEQNRAVATPPELVQYQQLGLALGHYRIGLAMLKGDPKNKAAEAQVQFLRCLELREMRVRDLEADRSLVKNHPTTIAAKLDRMLAQARVGSASTVADAVKTADGVNKICDAAKPTTSGDRIILAKWRIVTACGYSIAFGVVPPGDPQKPILRTKALAAVRTAIAAGYSNRAFLATDPDLDAIRGEPEFESAVAAVKDR